MADRVVPPLERAYRNSCFAYGQTLYDREAKIVLADRVRHGDKYAREQLVLSFLLYCEKLGYKYSCVYKGVYPRIESIDLAQIGVLTVLEVIDRALEKYDDPFPYIVLAVRREIAQYCHYQSGLIRIPETHDKNGKIIHTPYQVESIEAKEDEDLLVDLPPLTHQQEEYRELYLALAKLKGRTREVICRRFGLNGYSPESLPSISLALSNGKSKSMAGSYQAQAIKQLRKHLTQ